ncbi:DUF2971 domain-containing protein [Devosia sp. SL43]|uniref:DUF2971 domain-containing protein n=1 Tax=Devosia sp. SL43 TaxID=2806348 RepID=UPI001F3934B0|nr:DUF2971 domain-containing protein [Devosia sp. SL43]UJW85664.1 DUF2971 domain-containing protein [Devosia sp. SL43]
MVELQPQVPWPNSHLSNRGSIPEIGSRDIGIILRGASLHLGVLSTRSVNPCDMDATTERGFWRMSQVGLPDTPLPKGSPFMGIARSALDTYRPQQTPKELYHYTSTSGLLGILTNHSLWFTDTRYLNDSSEVLWGVGVVTKVAEAFANTRKEDRDKILVDRVVQRLETISMPNRAAVFCLCESANLLNQWRDYGRDVVSYSLGFDPTKLHMPEGYNFPPILIKMIYDEAKQIEIAQRVVAGVYAKAMLLPAETRDDPDRVSFLIDSAAHELSLVTYWFKNPAFEAEQEWRLLLEAGMIQNMGNTPLFRPSHVGITPYFEFKPTNEQLLPVTSLMVGPCSWPDAAMAAAHLLLNERGYAGLRLNASTIPIR